MTNDKVLEIGAAEASGLASDEKGIFRKAAKQASDAALELPLKRWGVGVFGAPWFWHLVYANGGLFFTLAPLQKEIEKRARRYRNKPNKFARSVEILIRRRQKANPDYNSNVLRFEYHSQKCAELGTDAANSNFTRSDRRRKADFLEAVGFLLPPQGQLPKTIDGGRLMKLMARLGTRTGRPPEDQLLLERATQVYCSYPHRGRKNKKGYRTAARKALEDLGRSTSQKEIIRLAKSVETAVRFRRNTDAL